MKKILLVCALLFFFVLPANAIGYIKYATVFSPTTGVRKTVVVGDPLAFKGDKKSPGGYVLETSYNYVLQMPGQLGFTVVTDYKTTLSRSITTSASTIYVSSLTTKDGHSLTMADLGSKVFFTIEPGSNKEEIVMCTGIGTLSWTSCTRGLAFYATSTAAVTANQKSHSAGSAIVMSNVHYVYDQLVDKDTANTIEGVKTYVSYPEIQSYVAPTSNTQFAPKKYVDDVISAGAPDATETTKGLTELATGAEAAAGTSSGGAARLVLPASIANSASSANTIVPVTGADGKLSANFIATSSDYSWTGTNTFSNINLATSTITGPLNITASTTFSGATTTFDSNRTLGAGFIHFQYKTDTGTSTWSRPTGVTKIKVKVVGGGGGGGSCSTGCSVTGGGGGGGYCEKIIDVSATSSINFYVGGADSWSTFGTNGYYCYANKGGSANNTPTGQSGGSAVGGDLNITGQMGGSGFTNASSDTVGNGGSSILGFGANAPYAQHGGTTGGQAGLMYGGGGSGCNCTGGGCSCSGGSGAQGIIIIEY